MGKAREVYSASTVEQYTDYGVVRQAILKACELVSEAYRQKFRNLPSRMTKPTLSLQDKGRLYLISGVWQKQLRRILLN